MPAAVASGTTKLICWERHEIQQRAPLHVGRISYGYRNAAQCRRQRETGGLRRGGRHPRTIDGGDRSGRDRTAASSGRLHRDLRGDTVVPGHPVRQNIIDLPEPSMTLSLPCDLEGIVLPQVFPRRTHGNGNRRARLAAAQGHALGQIHIGVALRTSRWSHCCIRTLFSASRTALGPDSARSTTSKKAFWWEAVWDRTMLYALRIQGLRGAAATESHQVVIGHVIQVVFEVRRIVREHPRPPERRWSRTTGCAVRRNRWKIYWGSRDDPPGKQRKGSHRGAPGRWS